MGCLTYTQQELSARSALDLCELHTEYRVNLSQQSRERLQNELDRRKIDCRNQLAAIKMKRDEELYDRMYRIQDP